MAVLLLKWGRVCLFPIRGSVMVLRYAGAIALCSSFFVFAVHGADDVTSGPAAPPAAAAVPADSAATPAAAANGETPAAPTKFLPIKEGLTTAKKSFSPLLVLCTLKGCH